MTRLGCRTQARRVFRQGNGIKPHLQHTPQYFSPICRCSGMCKTSLLDVETVRAQTNSGGSRGGNYPLTVTFSLSRDIETCQYPGGHHKYQSQLIVLAGVSPTSSSTPMGTELGSKSGMKGKY